ncbi:MAG: hypothetical protein JWM76_1331 [Pseudonocardiales bacterium]|nr:hypothetical protein [Pseudonocardiales bacterium]
MHIEELHRAGTDLESVATQLQTNARQVRSQDLAGNGPLTDAMISVENDWSRQRRGICAYLAGLGAGARAAADLYAAVDAELVKAMTPGPVGPMTPGPVGPMIAGPVAQ